MAKYELDKTGWSHSMKMGHRCASKGDYVNSIEYYLQASNEDSDDDALICNNLADSYMNIGHLGLAMDRAKKAISKARDKTLSYVTLGEIHQAGGEHEKAVECKGHHQVQEC